MQKKCDFNIFLSKKLKITKNSQAKICFLALFIETVGALILLCDVTIVAHVDMTETLKQSTG